MIVAVAATNPVEAALLADVAEFPDCSAAKQILADWLQEQGREHEMQAWRWIARTGRAPRQIFNGSPVLPWWFCWKLPVIDHPHWLPFETDWSISNGTEDYRDYMHAMAEAVSACVAHLANGGELPEIES